jgi:hypothetical protein
MQSKGPIVRAAATFRIMGLMIHPGPDIRLFNAERLLQAFNGITDDVGILMGLDAA